MNRALGVLPLLVCCACPSSIKRSYPPPQPATLVDHVKKLETAANSLRADTRADVWLGNERANVTVNILAARPAKLRFQAENPNNSMAADLASDGSTYCFLNANDNCGECGPATPESVGRLLGIVLEPDDIVTVLLGGTPLIEGDATVGWDSSNGFEIVTIRRDDGWTQRIALDGRGRAWDVRESIVKRPDGTTLFQIRHKDFHEVARSDGTRIRMPGASLFEQGKESAKIDWRKQEVDLEVKDAAFSIEVPAGLPRCGQ
jgi:hypothetical protein